MTERREQLRAGLEAVRDRIAAATSAAGREVGSVTLVVVTKTFPATDVDLLAELGVTEVGESRHPEAARKAAAARAAPRWHFVGALQTNKAAAVSGYADVVQSVDRERLVPALDRGAARSGKTVDCLVQVSLDPPERHGGRSGAPAEQVPQLAAAITSMPGLRLRGVMGVAPQDGHPENAFAQLSEVSQALRRECPDATWVSAGMSEDLEAAVASGATHVRVGRAILGNRPPLR